MGESLNPLDLFSIDVEAEVDKLCRFAYAQPEDAAVEAVRLLIQRGAVRVQVQLMRRRLHVVAFGARLSPEELRAFADVFDRRTRPSERHRQLVASEKQSGLGWLAVLGGRRGRASTRVGRSMA